MKKAFLKSIFISLIISLVALFISSFMRNDEYIMSNIYHQCIDCFSSSSYGYPFPFIYTISGGVTGGSYNSYNLKNLLVDYITFFSIITLVSYIVLRVKSDKAVE